MGNPLAIPIENPNTENGSMINNFVLEYPYLSEYSDTYKRRSPGGGKIILVRKGKRKKTKREKKSIKKLVKGFELMGTAVGTVIGFKTGEGLVKVSGQNGDILRNSKIGGALAGGAIAMMLAHKYTEKLGYHDDD